MAQADQTVQNDTFPTVRADINNNLAALFSASSGNTAPLVTVAFQDWIDTSGTDSVWKKRNAANNAWITVGTIKASTVELAADNVLPSQSGNSGKFLTTNGTDASWDTVLSLGSVITAGTAVASTSGTAIAFTGIPSWVKRVTVMFRGVSTNGTSPPLIQIGKSSGFVITGYLGDNTVAGTGTTVSTNFTSGFGIGVDTANWGAVRAVHGFVGLCLLGSDVWVASGSVGASDINYNYFTTGSLNLGGTLDRVRITTVNGTNTFDAGTINILYEG